MYKCLKHIREDENMKTLWKVNGFEQQFVSTAQESTAHDSMRQRNPLLLSSLFCYTVPPCVSQKMPKNQTVKSLRNFFRYSGVFREVPFFVGILDEKKVGNHYGRHGNTITLKITVAVAHVCPVKQLSRDTILKVKSTTRRLQKLDVQLNSTRLTEATVFHN